MGESRIFFLKIPKIVKKLLMKIVMRNGMFYNDISIHRVCSVQPREGSSSRLHRIFYPTNFPCRLFLFLPGIFLTYQSVKLSEWKLSLLAASGRGEDRSTNIYPATKKLLQETPEFFFSSKTRIYFFDYTLHLMLKRRIFYAFKFQNFI